MQAPRSRLLVLLPLLPVALLSEAVSGQAIFGTAGDGNLAVVFPNPSSLPSPAQTTVSGLPSGSQPHGVSPLDTDRAILSDFGNSRLFVVRISTNALLSTVATSSFNGTGTIALNPAGDALLCAGSATSGQSVVSSAAVVRNPRSPSPTVEAMRLTGIVRSYQTQGIVFTAAGRAYVSTTNGISILDPPYTQETATISLQNPYPAPNEATGALAISPDGTRLLRTDFYDSNGSTAGGDGRIQILSLDSATPGTPAVLTIPGGEGLDGIAITPDGTKALVASAFSPKLWVVSAPFSPTSTVEPITLPAEFASSQAGFEDLTISSDGQLALVTGNSARDQTGGGGRLPGLFVKAPFTRTGAQPFAVAVWTGAGIGRGAGAARFVACEAPAAPIAPAIKPQGNPDGPVTATDYLDLSWQPSTAGTPPTRYEWRINGDAYQATTAAGVSGVRPRGVAGQAPGLVNLFVRGYACSPEKGPGPEAKSPDYSLARPVASFSASKTSVRVGETVSFTDTSSPQATSWIWFFGNTALCETCQNPSLSFSAAGTYGVVLVATNGSGTSASAPTFITVTASSPPALAAPSLDGVEPSLEKEETLRFGVRIRPTLTLAAAEETVAWLQITTRAGELLAERRIVVTPGELATLDLAAYLPEGTRGRLDVRLVSDRPVTALFGEEKP